MIMSSCNITGIENEKLYPFVFHKGDYGYLASHLSDDNFTFYLCYQEYEKFSLLGKSEISGGNFDFENHSMQYGKYYSSEDVHALIQTFKLCPDNWFKQHYPFLEPDEEQWLWDNKDKSVSELVEEYIQDTDRKKELTECLSYYVY